MPRLTKRANASSELRQNARNQAVLVGFGLVLLGVESKQRSKTEATLKQTHEAKLKPHPIPSQY